MPSNKEIIADSIEKVLTSDESIDLLLISKSLDDINGEVVGTDPDYGMHFNYLYIGMSGQRMVDQMNSNWHATDAQFLAHNEALALRIVSNQIKEIKEENGVVSYTLDGENWTPLQASWGKIVGDITQQEDLQNVLAEKVDLSVFNELAAQVGSNANAILLLQSDLSDLESAVNTIANQINGTDGILLRLSQAEQLLAKKITSENVVEIRTVNGTALEFTTDGVTWHPVASAGLVEWGDIVGDIANQADLQLLFRNMSTKVDNAVAQLTEAEQQMNAHIQDRENPHNVTKEQLGLDKVNNTSDDEKPLSSVQQSAVNRMIEDSRTNIEAKVDSEIDSLKTEVDNSIKELEDSIPEQVNDAMKNVPFQSVSKTEFEALETKGANTLYLINDL